MADVSFGEWLKRRRRAKGLTQAQLAREISCSTSALKKIEAEERRPSTQVVERIAESFDLPPRERAAFLRFARGDSGALFSEAPETPPWRTVPSAARPNLPATTNRLIGREHETAAVREYLLRADVRLVTLIGPPGVGKTRLCIESARNLYAEFPDGVFFVALAPLDDPALLAATVANGLGFVSMRDITTLDQLKQGIAEKSLLIGLDNCEHLIEAAAALASELLAACPRLKLLATSRESLHISGEWIFPVTAFEVPDASAGLEPEHAAHFASLTLFSERARAVRPTFALTPENIKTISALCARVDGLPLAIELIAAQMRFMSEQTLLERLNTEFLFSADGTRAAPTRQKTLNDAIGWSYKLLEVPEKELLAHLSVFSGGFTLQAAESISSRVTADKSVARLVESLSDKSLVRCTFDARGEPRFDMLETIQQFASRELKAGNEAKVRRSHFAFFLGLADRADQALRGPHQLEWLNQLASENDNLRAALEWAIQTRQTEPALALVRKLYWFWFRRGDFMGARHWLGRVLAMQDTAQYPQAHIEALCQMAEVNMQLGLLAFFEAKPTIEQALTLSSAHRDKRNAARARVLLGYLLAEEGDFGTAQSLVQESKEYFEEVGDKWEHANLTYSLAWLALVRFDWANALVLFESSLTEFQNLGDIYFVSAAQRFVGRCHVNLGDLWNGNAALRRALHLAQELDNKFQIALTLWRGFSEAELFAGRFERAVILISAAIRLFQSIGAWMPDDDALFESELNPCRAVLGETIFEASMRHGRALTAEQAIQFALEM